MSGVLKIKLGEEYKAKIEKFEEFENSFFKEVYDKARECTRDIINSKNGEKLHENYNNIIAFVGERGMGKTSAMLSFAGALREGKYKEESFKGFETVGVIDPSLLHKNSNILEIIIAKMFHEFKNDVEKKDFEINENIKRDLLGNFETGFDSLRIINEKKDVFKEETLDALIKISETTNLKSNIEKLVNNYLKFKNKMGNSKLIIEIDDIDLNTKHAYEMIEQVRKYLVLPNIIILMAVKVEQLGQIIEKSYKQEFNILLNENNVNTSMTYEDIHTMTEKYLEKLIPLERRLYLPKLDNEGLENFVEIEGKKEEITLERKIRTLIYEKTGMMFFNTNTQYSYIIPKNLREYINFLSFLLRLSSSNKFENLVIFKNYFINHWVKTNLDSQHTNKINDFFNKEFGEINQFVVRMLESLYFEKIRSTVTYMMDTKELRTIPVNRRNRYPRAIIEVEDIVNFLNNPLNISIGDVISVLNVIDKFVIGDSDKKFIFAIKTIYSFILYEKIKVIKKDFKSINEISNSFHPNLKLSRADFIENIEKFEINVLEKEKIKNLFISIEENIMKYKKLVGWKIYSYENINTNTSLSIENRDFKKIESSLNKDEIEELLSYFIVDDIEDRQTGAKIEIESNAIEEFNKLKGNNQLNKIDVFAFFRNGLSIESLQKKDFYLGSIELLELLIKEGGYGFGNKSEQNFVGKIRKNIENLIKNMEKIKRNNGFNSTKINVKGDYILNRINDIIDKNLTEDDKTNINSLFVSELVEVSPGLRIHPTVLRDNLNKIIEKLDSLGITNRIKSVTTATEKLNEIKNILEDKKLSLMKPLKTLEYIDKKLDKGLEEKFDMKKIVKEIKEELKKDFRIDEGK